MKNAPFWSKFARVVTYFAIAIPASKHTELGMLPEAIATNASELAEGFIAGLDAPKTDFAAFQKMLQKAVKAILLDGDIAFDGYYDLSEELADMTLRNAPNMLDETFLAEDYRKEFFAVLDRYDFPYAEQKLDIDAVIAQIAARIDAEIADNAALMTIADRLDIQAIKTRLAEMNTDFADFRAMLNRVLQLLLRGESEFAKMIDAIAEPAPVSSPFHYLHPGISLHGREAEYEWLNQFLQQEDSLLFTAVVGSGGVGKSKLLYHYAKDLNRAGDWKACFLKKSTIGRINGFHTWHYPQKLLLVIDYAGNFATEIGEWLNKLCGITQKNRPAKLRIVFLERQGFSQEASRFLTEPQWFQKLRNGLDDDGQKYIDTHGYRANGKLPEFLEPAPLTDEALFALMDDFAKIEDKASPGAQEKAAIAAAVKEIEKRKETEGNGRALFVLFVTDAALSGKPYGTWDALKLMEHILKRTETAWKRAFGVGDYLDNMRKMLVYATACGGWDKENDEVPAHFEEAASYVLENSRDLNADFCAASGQTVYDEQLHALEPDLVGEFFVLEYINKENHPKTRMQLVTALWEAGYDFAVFLDRAIQDYANEGRFQKLFDKGMERLLPEEFEDDDSALLCAMLLVNLTVKQDETGRKKTVRTLQLLSAQYPGNAAIAEEYAKGLFNLSNKQNEEGLSEIVRTLQLLSAQYPENAAIAERYAKGLFNLRVEQQDEEGRKKTVEALQLLSAQYPENAAIAEQYAMGLVNLVQQFI